MLSDGFLNRAQKLITTKAAVKSASFILRYGSVRYQSSEAVARKRVPSKQRKGAKARPSQLRVCDSFGPFGPFSDPHTTLKNWHRILTLWALHLAFMPDLLFFLPRFLTVYFASFGPLLR